MKQYPDTYIVNVVCATCGTQHLLRSTSQSVGTDVCSNCHPAYTGEQRAAVTGSRVEQFNRRRALATA